MIIVKVEPYKASLDAIEDRLTEVGKEKSMHDVLKRAINDTAMVGKDKLHAGTKAHYTIKSGAFRESDIVKKSTSSRHPGATLTVKGAPIGVRKGYAYRRNGKRKGASTRIIASSAMKELKIQSGGHAYRAFMATMESGHIGIFQRIPGAYMKKHPRIPGISKGREAIKEIQALSRAKAAEMTYRREKMHSELQAEMTYRMLKHMHAVIGGTK